MSAPPAPSRERLGRVRDRLEAGDLLAFLYALVLVRQAFWLLPETTAWLASIGVAALLGFLRLRSRRIQPRLPAAFWLGTAAPLGLFWAIHLPYPDVGFDNLNYHILHGERALRGLLAIPGDFYPTYFPFLNPAPDMLAALLRAILGYRLGTIGSTLVLVWTGALLFRALERVIGSRVFRALAVLWVVCSEGVLWEVGNYMVDLYGLPLLLEAALLVLPGEEEAARDPFDDLPLIGLLLGSAVAFKLTNLVFAVAIGVVLLGRLVVTRSLCRNRRRAALSCMLAAAAFLLPLAPHTLLLWWTTGSPVFPHFNALFRSPLFPPFNTRDERFGPTSPLQALVWSVVSVFRPERLGEMGRTSGRLALGFLGAIAALLVRPRDRRLFGLAVIVILGSILWSFGSGIHRYGLFAELAGGLVLALLAERGLTAASGRGRAARIAAWLPIVVFGVQSLVILAYVRSDWSGRPTVFHEPRTAWKELRRVGFDRDLKRELPAGLKDALPTLAGWVDAVPTTSGLMALLTPRLPIVGLGVGTYFELPVNQARFEEALGVLRGHPLASLAFDEDLESARRNLARRGFVVRREIRYELPFFSSQRRFDIVMLEIEPPPVRPGQEGRVLSARELLLRRPPVSPAGRREDIGLLGSIDDPAEGAEIRGTLVVRGWARMPGQDLTVGVVLDGIERPVDELRRTARPDVESVVPGLGSCATAGYEARVVLRPEDAGSHELAVVLRAPDGRERHYPGRRIVVLAGP